MPVLMLDIAVGVHVAVVLLLFGKYIETRLPYVIWWTIGTTALAANSSQRLTLTPGNHTIADPRSGASVTFSSSSKTCDEFVHSNASVGSRFQTQLLLSLVIPTPENRPCLTR